MPEYQVEEISPYNELNDSDFADEVIDAVDKSSDGSVITFVLNEEGERLAAIVPVAVAEGCERAASRDLAAHLVAVHKNTAAFGNDPAANADLHQHEHLGPGGLRDHDPDDLAWDGGLIQEVLTEAVRAEAPASCSACADGRHEDCARPCGCDQRSIHRRIEAQRVLLYQNSRGHR